MKRTALDLLIVALLAGAIALVFAAKAEAHGAHNSFIKPAYDCFHDDDRLDTRGDVVITHDLDLAKYVVWECECEYLSSGYLVCWWRNKGQYTWKEDAVRRMRELEDYRYPGAVVVEKWVSWSSFHNGIGCNTHEDRRWVILSKRSG